ncbi:MAG: hypothetical protein U0Q03_07555 [Acidimicrobiales bacterium]
MKKWWELLEDELDAHSETAPDPWSDLDQDVVELTEAQQRFLASFDEQPPPVPWNPLIGRRGDRVVVTRVDPNSRR